MKQIKLSESKLVTITRSDLKTNGYIVPQTSHAIADFAFEHTEIFKRWKSESNSIICLSAKSEEHLLKLYEKYSQVTSIVKFFEPDVNEFTSICLYADHKIRKSLSNLPLTLKNNNTYEKSI